MKKLVTVAALTTTAVLSASAIAQEPVELRFSWWGGTTRHNQTLDAIKAFEEKHPNINVRAEYGGVEGYIPRLTTQIAGSTEPDIMQIDINSVDVFAPQGEGFHDLHSVENLNLDGYSQQNLAASERDSKLTALVVSMSGWAYYYNKNTWEKAGLEYPQTWDDLMHAGQVFQETLGEDYYPLVLNGQALLFALHGKMQQKYGEGLIDLENKQLAYENDRLEEMFAHYINLVESNAIASQSVLNAYGRGSLETLRPWIDGRWGGLFPATTSANVLQEFLEGDQVVELGPFVKREESLESGAHYRPSMLFAMSRNTSNPEEAARLLDFMLHDPEGVRILSDVRGIPFNEPSYKLLVDEGLVDESSLGYQGFLQMESLTYKTPVSSYLENDQLIAEFVEIIENIDYNNWTAERAAQQFRRRADRILRRVIRS